MSEEIKETPTGELEQGEFKIKKKPKKLANQKVETTKIDLSKKKVSGKKAENSLESVGITTNKNMVPFDERSPMITSGIRIGTPSLTTRGMAEKEMKIIARLIDKVISNIDNDDVCNKVKEEVRELSDDFPLYID